MKSAKEWLDEVSKSLNIEEKQGQGEKLSKVLLTSSNLISRQRKGEAEINNEQAKQIAKILKINPMLVIASTSYQKCIKTKEIESAKEWKNIYERVQKEEEIEKQTETME